MFGSLVVYLTHLTPHVYFSCIAHSHPLAHTFAILVMHWSIPCFFILACHVVAFCFVLGLSFIFPFILHPSCIISIVRSIIFCPFFLLNPLSIPNKKGENIPECFCHFYITLVHILRGRNSISHAHL